MLAVRCSRGWLSVCSPTWFVFPFPFPPLPGGARGWCRGEQGPRVVTGSRAMASPGCFPRSLRLALLAWS